MTKPCVRVPSALLREVFDMLPEIIAVVAESGKIVAFNEAWIQFAADNGNPALVGANIGDDYLRACRNAHGPDAQYARRAYEGITALLAGKRDYFEIEYPCHSSETRRRFRLQAFPLVYYPDCVLLGSSPPKGPGRDEGELLLPARNRWGTKRRRRFAVNLTTRQAKVLQHLVAGKSYREIAVTLEISPKTVDHHVAILKKKLDCRKPRDLVRVAMQRGLVKELGLDSGAMA